MNYNSYNPYGYSQPYTQPQPQSAQTIYHPLTFVSGLVGAQAFIVSPGQTVYLLDMQGKALYIKSADNQGRYSLQSYRLNDDVSPKYNDQMTMESFNARLTKLEEMINNGAKSVANVDASNATK